MKVIEFYFNPQLRKETAFESFCFEPSLKKEEGVGNLYLVGEIENVIEKPADFLLKKLSELIQKEYYSKPEEGPEERFKRSLEIANQFLKNEIFEQRREKLNFLILSLRDDFSLSISKIGSLKIFLIRGEEIFDLGEKLNFTSGTFNFFSTAIEGKLREGDRILIFSQKLFEQFLGKGLFQNLKEIKNSQKLKKLFKKEKKNLSEFFGILLFVLVKKRKKRIYLNLPKISFSFLKKVYPHKLRGEITEKLSLQSPILKEALKKSWLKILILILLLLLGRLIF